MRAKPAQSISPSSVRESGVHQTVPPISEREPASEGTGVYGLDADGTIVFINSAALSILGLTTREAVGQSVHGLFLRGSRETCPIRATLRDGVTRRGQGDVYHRADGTTFEVEYYASPRRDETGALRGAVVSFRDLTAPQRREQERLQLLAFLEMASKVGRIGAWSLELPHLVHRWSDATRAIHEADPDTSLGLDDLLEYYLPEDRKKVRRLLDACMTEGAPFDEELPFVTAKGTQLWVRIIGEAARDELGRIIRIQGAIQDITERKRAESSLLASENRFRQLAEAMPLVVWMANADGELDYLNQVFFDVTGMSRRALVTGTWVACLHPEDRRRCMRRWRSCVSTGEPYEDECRVRVAADGSFRWFRLHAQPISDPDGATTRWYGTGTDVHETKRLQEESASLAQRLAAILESITDAFFTVDREGRFTYLNVEAERLLGRCREELLGRTLAVGLGRLADSGVAEELERALTEASPVTVERHVPALDEWLELRVYPTHEGLAIHLRDVTELRRHREVLHASEERFRLLARATNDAIRDWDLETDELWWGDGLTTLFGFRVDDMDPNITSWTSRLHPADHDAVIAAIRAAVAGDAESWTGEYRFLRKDGTYAYVVERGHIVRDAHGRARRMVAGMTDLTERKLAEEKLREQATLLDKAQDAILVRDLGNHILYWNRSAERLYGWKTQEVLGRSAELLYTEPKALRAAFESTLANGEWSGELEQRTREGKTVTVEGHWTVVRDDSGRPKAILSINTDITERKRLEAQFLRAQRLESLGTLAGGIAHDLNNVFAPILMTTSLLRQDEADEARQRDLTTVQACAQRGADMVRQLLTFARGGTEGRPERINLAKVAEEVELIVRDTFPKDITFELDVMPGLWHVKADETQMHQVLTNLCLNARDAMPGGGNLTVSLENAIVDELYAGSHPDAKPGPYVVLRVADTGMGMAPELLERVFEPFFTTKELGKGTGLGLSTALSIVRSHGGFIQIASEAARGTTLHVHLPAEVAGRRAEAFRDAAEAPPRGRGELVLVVDDEECIRTAAARVLEEFGYRVVTAANGAEAVALYAQHRRAIAVVLTDKMMPVMDGPATAIALRSLDPEVRIIGSSGLQERGTKGDGGIEHWLPKPYPAEALLRRIHLVLTGPTER